MLNVAPGYLIGSIKKATSVASMTSSRTTVGLILSIRDTPSQPAVMVIRKKL
jgi:hypothetical protein